MKAIIGIDVSKLKLDCLWLRDEKTGKIKTKVLKNTKDGFKELITWTKKQTGLENNQLYFYVEATGIYHEALAYALYEAGCHVSVINPARIKDYGKSLGINLKTDKSDSRVIARYGLKENPVAWEPEPSEIRHLKALLARIDAIEKDKQREENRLEKAEITQVSKEVIKSIKAVIAYLSKQKKCLETMIDNHINKHPRLKSDRKLLLSIPGVGPVISRYMLAVIHSRNFKKASQCAAYLGLNPVEYESGTSVKKRPHLSKAGNAKIRAKLYMAAVVSIKHNPHIKKHYDNLLLRGKAKMSAIGAAMRKLVHLCFGVLKNQKEYSMEYSSPSY